MQNPSSGTTSVHIGLPLSMSRHMALVQRIMARLRYAGVNCNMDASSSLEALTFRMGGQVQYFDPYDWDEIACFCDEFFPLPHEYFTLLGHQDGEEIFPGEIWVDQEVEGVRHLAMMPPELALLRALEAQGATLALAESCTGGHLAARLTHWPGASKAFNASVVSYSNAAKIQILGVSSDTIEEFGAVSEETAREMALGVLPNADMACAISGIAGPGGATPYKPQGLVCFAWVMKGQEPQAKTYRFQGDRAVVQYIAVNAAIDGVFELL